MALPTFPVLYRRGTELHNPVVMAMDNALAHDPVIRSVFEGGYANTRARFARTPQKWSVDYSWLSQTNKNTLRTFENTRKAGAGSFTWINPEDSVTYTVRFLGLMDRIPHANTNFLFWTVRFVLEQV